MKRPRSLPRVHFMGIAGSGMSAAASIARGYGYEVSGCDMSLDLSQARFFKKQKIPVFPEHSSSHLDDCDILAISPAVIYQNPDHEEYTWAKAQNKVMTWQEFMGKFLHQNKKVICVAGTHGKSTTTALLGLCFQAADTDPTVEVGATVTQWNTNFRIGKGKYFISEADEYHDNFLNYSPETIILNNLELDHPEYFPTLEKLESSFIEFVKRLTGAKNLVINLDSREVTRLITSNQHLLSSLEVKCIGYTLQNHSLPFCDQIFRCNNPLLDANGATFKVDICSNNKCIFFDSFKTPLSGLHNVANILSIIATTHLYSIPPETIKKTLLSYQGIKRRMEEVQEKSGIKVFLDYAHHPTAVRVTLESFRQKYPGREIRVIFQPHTFSRLKYLLKDFASCFEIAKKVYVLPVFASREQDTGEISSHTLVSHITRPKTVAVDSFAAATQAITKEAMLGDIIVLMGAGDIYKLAPMILESL